MKMINGSSAVKFCPAFYEPEPATQVRLRCPEACLSFAKAGSGLLASKDFTPNGDQL